MRPIKKAKATMGRAATAGNMSSSGGSTSSSNAASGATPQTLLDLPGNIHTAIAEFLKLGEALTLTECAKLGEGSQAWYVHEHLYLQERFVLSHGSGLRGLLRRLQRVTKITAQPSDIIHPLALAISMGTCTNIIELHIELYGLEAMVSARALDCLGSAIKTGAMPALQNLQIGRRWERNGVQSLLHGFHDGASPNLHTLRVPLRCPLESKAAAENPYDDYDQEDDDDQEENEAGTEENLTALAGMLEARRRLGNCAGITSLPENWMIYGSVDGNMRVFRAMFVTLKSLVLEGCTLDDQACEQLGGVIESEQVLVPKMATLLFRNAFGGAGGGARIFHSIGNTTAFECVQDLNILEPALSTDAFRALGSTLGKNALRSLVDINIRAAHIGSDGMVALVRGLEDGACGQILQTLNLVNSGLCAEGVKALGLAIARDSLPSLRKLILSNNDSIGSKGVTYLAHGLQASSRTKLLHLLLCKVGMEDEGLKALTEAVNSGVLVDLYIFGVAKNPALRDFIPLANALKSGGLKNLARFLFAGTIIEPRAVAILAYAFTAHCPQFERLSLPEVGPDTQQTLKTIRASREVEGQRLTIMLNTRELERDP